jgi:hypothetical protein
VKIPGADQFVIDEAKIRDYLLSTHGPAGRDARIVVVWIILDGEQFPRFVTAYPGARS